MSTEKRRLIRTYFEIGEPDFPSLRKLAKYGTAFFVIGILLLYFEQINLIGNFKIISVILILSGLFSIWILVQPFVKNNFVFKNRAEDGDMDVWFLEDMHEIVKPRALEQLSINPSSLKEENIIIVPYPIYWNYPGINKEEIYRKKGEDGSFIYSVWQVQILVVTENFISYYSCAYNWPETKRYDERTNEYFFDDISSVSNDIVLFDYKFIDNEEIDIANGKVFKLANLSGDKLTIITDIPSLNVPAGYSNNLERLVQAIRKLLRNRRFGEEIEVPINMSEEDGVEFEIDTKSAASDKLFFHQQLRELYKDYNKVFD